MQTSDTSVTEGAVPQGYVKFQNIKDKYFFDMDLWRIKNGVYTMNPYTGKSNIDEAITYWTQLIPPESNFYEWASTKYTALEIIINAIYQRIFVLNRKILETESGTKYKNELKQLEEEIQKLQNDINVLKEANKQLTQAAEKISKLAEKKRRQEQEDEREERAARREAKKVRT